MCFLLVHYQMLQSGSAFVACFPHAHKVSLCVRVAHFFPTSAVNNTGPVGSIFQLVTSWTSTPPPPQTVQLLKYILFNKKFTGLSDIRTSALQN